MLRRIQRTKADSRSALQIPQKCIPTGHGLPELPVRSKVAEFYPNEGGEANLRSSPAKVGGDAFQEVQFLASSISTAEEGCRPRPIEVVDQQRQEESGEFRDRCVPVFAAKSLKPAERVGLSYFQGGCQPRPDTDNAAWGTNQAALSIVEACIFSGQGLTTEARLSRKAVEPTVHSICKHQ